MCKDQEFVMANPSPDLTDSECHKVQTGSIKSPVSFETWPDNSPEHSVQNSHLPDLERFHRNFVQDFTLCQHRNLKEICGTLYYLLMETLYQPSGQFLFIRKKLLYASFIWKRVIVLLVSFLPIKL
jgi:hypothetical protein